MFYKLYNSHFHLQTSNVQMVVYNFRKRLFLEGAFHHSDF